MKIPSIVTNKTYEFYEEKLEEEVSDGPMPRHIAIIMDGNRRYAKELGLETREGHLAGKEKIRDVLNWCLKLGIRNLTVYAFSTENFNRDESEVNFLMELIETTLREMADDPEVEEKKIRIQVIGEKELVPESMQETIRYAEEKTKDNDQYTFSMAIAYGGRQEIISALKDIATKVKNGELEVDDINEEMVSEYLYTTGMPDPDLVLRTSGELRISNFLLWQLAYSELYFTDVYWPSFRYIDLLRAIRSYQKRARRFGK
jgi:tritrans,polycis-undecaprenyl-diphosphate synthase [geranylgeranyl-diphosphate specific]